MERIGDVYRVPQGNGNADIIVGHLMNNGYELRDTVCFAELGGGHQGSIQRLVDHQDIYNGDKRVGTINPQRVLSYEPNGNLSKVLEAIEVQEFEE